MGIGEFWFLTMTGWSPRYPQCQNWALQEKDQGAFLHTSIKTCSPTVTEVGHDAGAHGVAERKAVAPQNSMHGMCSLAATARPGPPQSNGSKPPHTRTHLPLHGEMVLCCIAPSSPAGRGPIKPPCRSCRLMHQRQQVEISPSCNSSRAGMDTQVWLIGLVV